MKHPYDTNCLGFVEWPFPPSRRADVVAQRAGKETLLYDPVADTVHVLNATAWAIWEFCDGEHSLDEVEMRLRARFAAPSEQDVKGDIAMVLAVFAQNGLIHRHCPTER